MNGRLWRGLARSGIPVAENNNMSARPQLFISYRRSRRSAVVAAQAALQAVGVTVWLDLDDIPPLAEFDRRIREGIDASHAMLVWYSNDYPDSDICLQELRRAWQHARRHSSDVARRVWILNPEASGHHIHAGELNRSNFLAPPVSGQEATWAQSLRGRLDGLLAEGPMASELHTEPMPTLYGVPRPSAQFTGRGGELMRIHSALFPPLVGEAATGVAVQTHGMGGVGKTELAAKYVHEFAQAFPAGVLWLNLAGWQPVRPATEADGEIAWLRAVDKALASHHGALLRELMLDTEGRAVAPAEVRARLTRHLTTGAPYLVVLDNLPELSPLDVRHRIINSLAAAAGEGKTLVTTRDARPVDGLSGIRLDVMGLEDALRLLACYFPEAERDARLDAQQATMRELVREVGGHTLALVLLGEHHGGSAAGYPRALESLRIQGQLPRIEAIANELKEELGERARGIVATFMASIEPLAEEARRLLALASVCAPNTPIPETLLAIAFGTAEADSFARALRSLERASLLERRNDDGHWQIHPLLAQAALALLEADPTPLAEVLAKALRKRLLALNGDRSQARGLVAEAAQAYFVAPGQRNQNGVMLWLQLQFFEDGRGQLGLAKQAGTAAWDLAREVLGEEHPDTLASMTNLALTLHSLGDFAGARGLEEQTLAVCRRVLGEEHPDTLSSMHNLARTLLAQGDLAGAQGFNERVLAVRRRVLDEGHPDTLKSMENLALTLRSLGDFAEARGLVEQTLAGRRRVLGEEHPDTLQSMINLGVTLSAQGDLAGALGLGEQTLAVCRRVLGEEHPDTLKMMHNLAVMLRAQGDRARARGLDERVLEVRRRVLGEEHPDTLKSMTNLAVTLSAQGDLVGARGLEEQTLAVCRRVLGEEHRDTLQSMINLAVTLSAQGDFAGARGLREQVLAVRRQMLGEEHPDTTVSAWNLFCTLDKSGDAAAAGEFLRAHLSWLVDRAPEALGADQQTIQQYVRQAMRRDGGHSSPAILRSQERGHPNAFVRIMRGLTRGLLRVLGIRGP